MACVNMCAIVDSPEFKEFRLWRNDFVRVRDAHVRCRAIPVKAEAMPASVERSSNKREYSVLLKMKVPSVRDPVVLRQTSVRYTLPEVRNHTTVLY
jgi:hypothetical protein